MNGNTKYSNLSTGTVMTSTFVRIDTISRDSSNDSSITDSQWENELLSKIKMRVLRQTKQF